MQPQQTYICLLLSLIILISTVILVSGLQFTYQPSGSPDFAVQPIPGAIPPASAENVLWLTPDSKTTKADLLSGAGGRVVYPRALPLFNPISSQVVSFSTFFNFTIITPGAGYGNGGDGLAFSISPILEISVNSRGESLGVANASDLISSDADHHLFAVEFDTYRNPAFSDPSSSHIGIDFNGLTSNATFDSSPFRINPAIPQSNLYLYNNYTIFAWVEYDASLHVTQVFASNVSEKPSQSCVNITYDLSYLFDPHQSLYAAISATSGASVQSTALYSWSFANDDVYLSPSPSPALLIIDPPPTHLRSYVLPLVLSLLGLLLLVFCGLLRLLLYKRKKDFPAMLEMLPSTGLVPRYSYRDLYKATQGFRDTQKLGEGGFSSVYKGTLPATRDVVAVKRLKEGLRMEVEFASEIQIISGIRHRNLLQLRGWGYERGEALLVYQYMPNGSLDSYLFGKKREEKGLIKGGERFTVLVGVAAALEYLHEGLGECVLHRDVKAANVMLTERFEAKLGDFGLARLITHDQVMTMTAAGTRGYVAPEVVYTGRATDKADVYSFGILALEVACGRRAMDESLPPEEMLLLDWVWHLQQSGKLMDALDPVCCPPPVDQQGYDQQTQAEISNSTDENAGQITEKPLVAHMPDHEDMANSSGQELKWQCVLHLALLCCNPWPEDRPTMRQVHHTLRDSLVLPLPSTRPTYGRPAFAAGTVQSFESSSSISSASFPQP